MIRAVAALLAGALALACGGERDPAAAELACGELRLTQAPEGASLVLIVNDTMRRDRVGAYGGPAATPAFDAFARENLLFGRASSQAPWTKPAVASLFTGLYPSQHGVIADPRMRAQYAGDTGVLEADVLAPELVTLAEVMRDAGFRTAAFVSNPWLDRPFGFDQGFAVYDDSFARFDADGEVVTRAGLAWLDALPPGERFFLYLHYIDSHQPYGRLSAEEVLAERRRLEADPRPVPREAQTALEALRTPQGESLLLSTGVRPTRAVLERAYDEGIHEFDRALGAFLDGLRAHEAWARSAVIVTSDHGEALFERGYGNHARALHDDELAVPLAARLPGVEGGDGRVDCTVGLIDLMPTLCQYFGLSCPAEAGESFLSASAPRYLAAEGVPDFAPHRAIRNREYKLIYEPGGTLGPDLVRDRERGRTRPFSLYDLRADPAERRDLLAEGTRSPEVERVFATLRKALESVVPPGPETTRRTAPIDPELQRRLEELGYADPEPP